MRWVLVCVALAAGGCPGPRPVASPPVAYPPGPAGATWERRGEVERLVRPFLEGEWARGVVIGLHAPSGDEVYGFGLARDDQATPPDGDTLFEIGSVTKVFTALALAEAAERGVVELEAPLNGLLPPEARLTGDGEKITLAQLATHTSGLPRMPAYVPKDPADPYASLTEALVLATLPSLERNPPGEKYAYSNLGMGLVGDRVARAAGRGWAEWIADWVLRPLELGDTGVAVRERDLGRLAQGHDAGGQPVPGWHFGALAGCGGLRSTVNDLLAFLAAQIDPAERPIARAIRLSQIVRHEGPEGRLGLGWHIRPDGTYWHNGETGGFHAFVAFDLDKRVGVVVLANQASGAIDQLGILALGLLRGGRAEPRLPPTVHLPPDKLRRLVGDYALAPEFVLSVREDKGRLTVQATGQPRLPVFAAGERELYYRHVDARLVFELDGHGPAQAVTLHQNGRALRGERRPASK